MRVLGGFAVGLVVGCFVGAVVASLVIEAIGAATRLPPTMQMPDRVPDAWTVTT